MPILEIKNHKTGETIYKGQFNTVRQCIEQAINEQVNLDFADLQYTNLSNAMLDNAHIRHALLDNANLSGTNLSEATLDGTSFRNATLHNACLCESRVQNCDFTDALFGATDIAGSNLAHCHFSTLSAFTLNFTDCDQMGHCAFIENPKLTCPFSHPPILIHGLSMPVVFMDEHLKIGGVVKSYNEWFLHMNDNMPPSTCHDDRIITFFRKYQAMFREMHEGMHHMPHTAEIHRRIIAN